MKTIFTIISLFLSVMAFAAESRPVMIVANYIPQAEKGLVLDKIRNDTDNVHFGWAIQEKNEWKYTEENTFAEALNKIQSGRDILIFVHGDGKELDGVFETASYLSNLYNVDVIAFAWPSKVYKNEVRNFRNSEGNVKKYFENFVKMLTMIQDYKDSHPNVHSFNFLLHSLGNLYLKEFALNQKMYNIRPNLFNNIILNAPAIPRKKYSKWIESLNIQKNIFITNNNKDFALKGLHYMIAGKKQLGEKANGPFPKNAVVVNFTRAVGFRFPLHTTHTYFYGDVTLESNNIREFYDKIFHGMVPNLNNSTKFIKRRNDYLIIH